jgi:hypothetical protein
MPCRFVLEESQMAKAPKKPTPLPWHARFGNLAQIASACIALVGFFVVGFQLRESRMKASAEALRAELSDARKVYMSYSEAQLKYPQFSEPNLIEIKKDPIEFIRYKNFVALMLYAYDAILASEDRPEWEKSFQDDVLEHIPYLCTTGPEYEEMYFPIMLRLIRDVKAAECHRPTPGKSR